jgi:RES domain-containing protein
MGEVVGWRIVSERHARTAFSGEGARMFEGRWNSRGVRMVYCSESLALAALEILVHTQPVIPRQNYRAFRVSWRDKLMTRIELKTLPVGWDAQPPGPTSKKLGDDWIKSGRSLVLSVPSVIVPQERTFLLNPHHRDFSQLKIAGFGRFALDRRLH